MCSVILIFKFNDPSDIKNYRFISIIPDLAKLFESLVYNRIKRNFNHIIINEQHGFKYDTRGIVYTTYITGSVERGNLVAVIFTDLLKAFDSLKPRCEVHYKLT